MWALIASMYVGNVILLILNLPLVGLWVKLLAIPRPLLYAGILIFATLGAYGLRNSWFDLLLLYLIGLVGFLMRRYDVPVAPVHRGHDPRAARGEPVPPRARHQPGRPLGVRDPADSARVLLIAALTVIVPPVWRRVERATRDARGLTSRVGRAARDARRRAMAAG